MGQRLKTVVVKRRPRPRPTPVQAKPLVDHLRQWLVLTAEISAMAGGVGFVVSAAFWTVVFNNWGISYLQIASPSDVIMGGLAVALLLAFMIGPLALAILLAFWIVRIVKITRRMGWLIGVIASQLFLFVALAWAPNTGLFLLITLLGMVFIGISIFTFHRPAFAIRFLTVLGVLSIAGSVLALSISYTTKGLQDGRVTVAPSGCQMMWMGSQNMVTRCDGEFQIIRSEHFTASVGQRPRLLPREQILQSIRTLLGQPTESTEAPERATTKTIWFK